MPVRIAIPQPTTSDVAYNSRNWGAYARAIEAHGGEPVQIPLKLAPRELAGLADGCQAILLPGSPADVDPVRFGQKTAAETSPADPFREATDLLLLEHAQARLKPLLGICYGCQILNVFHGGTLVQDLAVMPVNHPSAAGVLVAHDVQIAPGSLLDAMVSHEEALAADGFLRLPVNSSHHQAVGVAGEGLQISARCPQDAVVEAIEGAEPGRFLMGVQWHPERTTEQSAASRAIFERLVREGARWS